MGLYLTPKSSGTAAIAVCDRCKMKAYYSELVADGNSPGLRVHEYCRDVKDPYRYAARKTENISLRYPRPDESLKGATVWVDTANDLVVWRNNLNQAVDWMPI